MRTCSQKNTGEHSGPTEVSLHTRKFLARCLGHVGVRSGSPSLPYVLVRERADRAAVGDALPIPVKHRKFAACSKPRRLRRPHAVVVHRFVGDALEPQRFAHLATIGGDVPLVQNDICHGSELWLKKSGGSHGSDNALPEVRKTYGPGCTGISDDQLVTFGMAYLKEILEPDPRYTGW